MSEMVERVARKLHDQGYLHEPLAWNKCAESYREEKRRIARAAIATMREPTAAMLKVPDIADDYGVIGEIERWRATEIWQSMIDEALK